MTTATFRSCFLWNEMWMASRYLNRRFPTINVIVFPPEIKFVVFHDEKCFCIFICLLLKIIHRCLLMSNVDLYASSLQNCFEISFDLVEHFVFYLLWMASSHLFKFFLHSFFVPTPKYKRYTFAIQIRCNRARLKLPLDKLLTKCSILGWSD